MAKRRCALLSPYTLPTPGKSPQALRSLGFCPAIPQHLFDLLDPLYLLDLLDLLDLFVLLYILETYLLVNELIQHTKRKGVVGSFRKSRFS